MLKSGSLELSSAKQQMSDREKALWAPLGDQGQVTILSGPWFPSNTREVS